MSSVNNILSVASTQPMIATTAAVSAASAANSSNKKMPEADLKAVSEEIVAYFRENKDADTPAAIKEIILKKPWGNQKFYFDPKEFVKCCREATYRIDPFQIVRELVKLFLSSNPKELVLETDEDENTALHYALYETDFIDFGLELIKAGADPWARNYFGFTPLHLYFLNFAIDSPADKGMISKYLEAAKQTTDVKEYEEKFYAAFRRTTASTQISHDCQTLIFQYTNPIEYYLNAIVIKNGYKVPSIIEVAAFNPKHNMSNTREQTLKDLQVIIDAGGDSRTSSVMQFEHNYTGSVLDVALAIKKSKRGGYFTVPLMPEQCKRFTEIGGKELKIAKKFRQRMGTYAILEHYDINFDRIVMDILFGKRDKSDNMSSVNIIIYDDKLPGKRNVDLIKKVLEELFKEMGSRNIFIGNPIVPSKTIVIEDQLMFGFWYRPETLERIKDILRPKENTSCVIS